MRSTSDASLPRAHGLMFHHFHSPAHPAGQGSIGADELRRMIHQVGVKRIVPAREWLDRAIRGTLKPSDVCLTFDDNLRCQFDVAMPVLREMNLTAFWFVYTSVLQGNLERLEIYRHFRMTYFPTVDDFYGAFFITVFESEYGKTVEHTLAEFDPREYLNEYPFYTDADRRFRFVRDEVLGPDRYGDVMNQMMRDANVNLRAVAQKLWMDELAVLQLHKEAHVIGLHSHTHPTRIERLSLDDQRYEYRENYNYLRVILNERPLAMSHPCNSYNDSTLMVLRDLGIEVGFRANMFAETNSALEFPREDHANLLRQMKQAA